MDKMLKINTVPNEIEIKDEATLIEFVPLNFFSMANEFQCCNCNKYFSEYYIPKKCPKCGIEFKYVISVMSEIETVNEKEIKHE